MKPALKLSLEEKNNFQRLVLFQKAVAIICLIMMVTLVNQTNQQVTELSRRSQNVYWVVDEYFGGDEARLRGESDSISRLASFREGLKEIAETYVIVNRQHLFIEESLPRELSVAKGVTDPELAEILSSEFSGLEVGQEFFSHFKLEAITGRVLEGSDYAFSIQEAIPLVAGFDFSEELTLGRQLTFLWKEQLILGEVVGVLPENAYFNNSFDLETLDDKLIIPAYYLSELKAGGMMLSPGHTFLTAIAETAGFLISPKSTQWLQLEMNELSNKLNLLPYRLIGGHTWQLNIWGLTGRQLGQKLWGMAVMLLIISLISTTMTLINQIANSRKTLAIYISQGLTYRELYYSYSKKLLIENSWCLLISLGVNYGLHGQLPLVLAGGLLIVLLSWESLIVWYSIKNVSLISAIREE